MLKPSGVHHVGFGVRDLEKAEKFYKKTLEFTATVEQVNDSINSMADTFRNSQHSLKKHLLIT